MNIKIIDVCLEYMIGHKIPLVIFSLALGLFTCLGDIKTAVTSRNTHIFETAVLTF